MHFSDHGDYGSHSDNISGDSFLCLCAATYLLSDRAFLGTGTSGLLPLASHQHHLQLFHGFFYSSGPPSTGEKLSSVWGKKEIKRPYSKFLAP